MAITRRGFGALTIGGAAFAAGAPPDARPADP
jgi:hypothetical protein